MPFSASTSSPESSATEGNPVAANASRALANALSSNVAPVSGASSKVGTSESDTSSNASPAPSSTRRNSANFLRLRLATSKRLTSAAERLLRRRPFGQHAGIGQLQRG